MKERKGFSCKMPLAQSGMIWVLVLAALCWGQLGPEHVLILVNADSQTSLYIAKLYRQYYPAIPESRVVYLYGLPDSAGPASTPADEIISRADYEQKIAQPVRDYLLANQLSTTIRVIITTAGIPYRIKDDQYPSAIMPAASDPTAISNNIAYIQAASVESELTCLWYTQQFGAANRMVNPYQGYRQSPITAFPKLPPDAKTFNWTTAIATSGTPPKMEGQNLCEWPNICYGTMNRQFHAGDIYLTCRLDGPKNQGQSAVFAVRRMLERAKRASNPAIGVNPAQAVVVIDDAPNKTIVRNRVFNLDGSTPYVVFDPAVNQPPNACKILIRNDFVDTFTALTSATYNASGITAALSIPANALCVLLDRRTATRTSQSDLDALLADPLLLRQAPQYLAALACYGNFNGDEPANKYYLLSGGPNGAPLYKPTNGAVFNSVESFNAVTMFSNAETTQAKIVDFIAIGGSGAIGHSFEPLSDAIVDNLYFLYNLFADHDGDGKADLTFVEAAFTGLPYLSWSEVVIGDPLMRICYGPGQEAWEQFATDVNFDDRVDIRDIRTLQRADGGILYGPTPEIRAKYNDLCDFNKDGFIDIRDIRLMQKYDGAVK